MDVLDKQYKSPIQFLGKPRELAKTTRKTSNKLIYLLKKNAYIHNMNANPDLFMEEIDAWFEESKEFIKSIISPITDEEMEDLEIEDLELIQNAIDRRKYIARGYTHAEVDAFEAAGRKSIVSRAIRLAGDEIVDDEGGEDFQSTVNTAQDGSTSKQNTTAD